MAVESGERGCTCKGQCARKSGRGACKCRVENLKCDVRCGCDRAKCKNKDTNQPEPNADRRHGDQNEFDVQVQNSEREITEFVATLDADKKDQILITLLSMGRGSLDFAKTLAEADDHDDPPPDPSGPLLPWCRCTVCRPMETENENVCCKRATCITSYRSFANICLDRDILEVCIKARCDIRADDFNFSMESFRKAAYRQYVLWRFGKLGRGNRRVLPACVVRMIRAAYPAHDGRYMGFRAN